MGVNFWGNNGVTYCAETRSRLTLVVGMPRGLHVVISCSPLQTDQHLTTWPMINLLARRTVRVLFCRFWDRNFVITRGVIYQFRVHNINATRAGCLNSSVSPLGHLDIAQKDYMYTLCNVLYIYHSKLSNLQ